VPNSFCLDLLPILIRMCRGESRSEMSWPPSRLGSSGVRCSGVRLHQVSWGGLDGVWSTLVECDDRVRWSGVRSGGVGWGGVEWKPLPPNHTHLTQSDPTTTHPSPSTLLTQPNPTLPRRHTLSPPDRSPTERYTTWPRRPNPIVWI